MPGQKRDFALDVSGIYVLTTWQQERRASGSDAVLADGYARP